MKRFCADKKSKMFNLLAVFELSEVRNLTVHDTKEPAITFQLFRGQFEGKAKLLFPGDMERQMFVARIWDLKKELASNKKVVIEQESGTIKDN